MLSGPIGCVCEWHLEDRRLQRVENPGIVVLKKAGLFDNKKVTGSFGVSLSLSCIVWDCLLILSGVSFCSILLPFLSWSRVIVLYRYIVRIIPL